MDDTDDIYEAIKSIVEARHNVMIKLYDLAMGGNVPAAAQFMQLSTRYVQELDSPPHMIFADDENPEPKIPDCG